MKEKILTFIIGVLVGAIIATGGYYFYSKSNDNRRGMPDGERPAMMQQDGNNTDGNSDRGTPPEKPSDDDGSGPKGEPGQKDSSSNTQENKTTTDKSENNV